MRRLTPEEDRRRSSGAVGSRNLRLPLIGCLLKRKAKDKLQAAKTEVREEC